MIDFTKTIYSRPDGTFVATLENGYPYHVVHDDPLYVEVEAYLKANCIDARSEPPPPEPTEEEKRKQELMNINSQFLKLDQARARPLAAYALGRQTKEDTERLTEIEDEAATLRARLAELKAQEEIIK